MYPAIKQLYSKGQLGDRGVLLGIGNGCLPDEHINRVDEGYHCDSLSKYAMLRAEKDDIDAVFIGFSTWTLLSENVTCVSSDGRCVKMLSRDELRRHFLADLSDQIRTLHDLGKHVIVSLPFPVYDKSIPEVEISNALFGRLGLSKTAREISSPSFREEIRAVAVGAGAAIFDPRLSLCQGQDCLNQVSGISIYRDDNHLAGSQVGILEGNLRDVLQRELVERPISVSLNAELAGAPSRAASGDAW
jgi:hypothetical protein